VKNNGNVFINILRIKSSKEDEDDEVESVEINKSSVEDILKIIYTMQEADMCSFDVDDIVRQLEGKK
jgi:hypothetical protein